MGAARITYLFYAAVFCTFLALALIYGDDRSNLTWITDSVFGALYALLFLVVLSRIFKRLSYTKPFSIVLTLLLGFLFAGLLFLAFARIGA